MGTKGQLVGACPQLAGQASAFLCVRYSPLLLCSSGPAVDTAGPYRSREPACARGLLQGAPKCRSARWWELRPTLCWPLAGNESSSSPGLVGTGRPRLPFCRGTWSGGHCPPASALLPWNPARPSLLRQLRVLPWPWFLLPCPHTLTHSCLALEQHSIGRAGRAGSWFWLHLHGHAGESSECHMCSWAPLAPQSPRECHHSSLLVAPVECTQAVAVPTAVSSQHPAGVLGDPQPPSHYRRVLLWSWVGVSYGRKLLGEGVPDTATPRTGTCQQSPRQAT